MHDLLSTLLDSDIAARRFARADEHERLHLVEELMPFLAPGEVAARTAVLSQIADGVDPEVIPTCQRLLEGGLPREQVLNQVALAVMHQIHAVLGDQVEFDDDAYHRSLDALPLPTGREVEEAMLPIARDERVLHDDALLELTADHFGLDLQVGVVELAIQQVEEALVTVPFGPLQWIVHDRVVSTEALAEDVVLTHTLTAEEIDRDELHVGVDLALFAAAAAPDFEGEEVEGHMVDRDDMVWLGPDGWLQRFSPGTTVAARLGMAEDPVPLTLSPLDDVPEPREELVAAVRRVYEDATADAGLPVHGLELLATVLADDPRAFTRPEAPLRDLCAAAGLEIRGADVAGDEAVWEQARRTSRLWPLMDRTEGDPLLRSRCVSVLASVDDLADGLEVDGDELASALADLADLDVLAVIDDLLVNPAEDGTPRPDIAELLLPFTRRGEQTAAVRYLAAVQAERVGDTMAAEQHLELAYEADRDYPPSTDRLAWYASDRGDARRAVSLLRRLPGSVDSEATIRDLQPFTKASRELPRNAPCWCGSGRKYKRCHAGVPQQPPLSDRVNWLCRKAASFVYRSGPAAQQAMAQIVGPLAGDYASDETLEAAMDDPIFMDLVLTEGGWFAEFFHARGGLLPDDEALLVASWLTVDRTVYEVTDVRPGEGVTVRDLRTGDVIEVRDRTLSGDAEEGQLLCARAVPDGETTQFIGGVFEVGPGREAALLEVLDRGDPIEIAMWVREATAPPRLAVRDDEGRLVEVDDAEQAADLLAARSRFDEMDLDLGEVDLDELAPDDPAVLEGIRDHLERRWLEEEVPALGGVTPRQAAADPTRRDQLERLLRSFERMPEVPGGISMRPARLRELLDL